MVSDCRHAALHGLTFAACFTESMKDCSACGVLKKAPLRVPLQTQYKAWRTGTEHSLDRIILGDRLNDQSGSRTVDRVAVQGVHHDPGFADNPGQRTA